MDSEERGAGQEDAANFLSPHPEDASHDTHGAVEQTKPNLVPTNPPPLF